MNHAEIKNAILTYVEDSPDVEYAIMLDGSWGAGKTFFFNNSIKPSLEREVVYVSLYGVTSLDDIYLRIASSIYTFSKKKLGKQVSQAFGHILSIVSSFFGVGRSIERLKMQVLMDRVTLKLKTENSLLVFDDLERLGTGIAVEDVFGILNVFVEHNKIKTIVICDEEKVSKKFEGYKVSKEKVVGHSYKFKADIKNIIGSFIDSEFIENSSILNEKAEVVTSIFSSCDDLNLRTVKRALSIVDRVLSSLEKAELDYEPHLDEILIFICSIVTEISLGQNCLTQLSQWVEEGYDYTPFSDSKDAGESYITGFLGKYYGESGGCQITCQDSVSIHQRRCF
jgi:hemerythrin-like domain-containing protein